MPRSTKRAAFFARDAAPSDDHARARFAAKAFVFGRLITGPRGVARLVRRLNYV